MGLLVDGVWRDDWYDTEKTRGRFERSRSSFRAFISADGSTDFKAAPRRYHLYVAQACPWAHRTVIFRKLKKLENVISISIVAPEFGEQGWYFGNRRGATADAVSGCAYLHQLYTAADPEFTGRVTVPVLWDKKARMIVNNESSEIIRMFNSAFDAFGDAGVDFYPAELRAAIDEINGFVYDNVNNGVYKCGFATTQEAYEEAFDAQFSALDELEARLGRNRYLLGERLTEADWRLFVTLVRFDVAYYGNFKCNKRRIADYEHLWGYTRELYQMPGIAETVNFDHIKHTYYGIRQVNPTGIVPKGPELDFTAPHHRDQLSARS